MQDLRQSDLWAQYLQTLGWEIFYTKNKIKIYVHRKFGFSMAKVQRPNNLTTQALDEIKNIAMNQKCFFILLEPVQENKKLFAKNGFIKTQNFSLPPKTLVLNLKKEENPLWEELSKSAKYSIKRAKREKIKIEIYKNPSVQIIKDFYHSYQQNATPNKFAKFSFEELKEKVNIFKNDSFLTVSRDKNSVLCGGILCLSHKKGVWYLHGGTTQAGRKTKAGYLLFWETILYFKNNGYEFFDLEGIKDIRFAQTKSWQGFSNFKKRLGGYEKEYPKPYIKPLHFIGKIAIKFRLL